MERTLIALAVVAVLAVPAAAQTPTPEPPVVVAAGTGIVKKAPDRAWVNVTAESRARSPREAQKLNADVMAAVLQKLRGAGFSGDAVQTRGYDLQPEYDYANGRQTLRGYVARNSVEVRVDDLPRTGEVLDLAVSAGATSVGGVRFDLKERTALERDALRLAVEDARKRAEASALGAGMKVERVVRIEEHGIVSPVPPPRPMIASMRGQMAEAAQQPPIEAGELEIRAMVTLTATIR